MHCLDLAPERGSGNVIRVYLKCGITVLVCALSLSLSLRVMILSWKLKGGEAKWTAADDLRLIESLNEDEELEDEEDVDWERLSIDWPR